MTPELRLGDYRTALADVEQCDAVICDPPYSEHTHSGHDDGTASANRVANWAQRRIERDGPDARFGQCRVATFQATVASHGTNRRSINYRPWAESDVSSFVEHWAPRCFGWMVVLTDHVLAPTWQAAFEGAGRYAFAPLACVEPGSRVRLTGDGPTQWSVWAVVSRPRDAAWLAAWREERQTRGHGCSLRGAYVVPRGQGDTRSGRRSASVRAPGGKPLWLMRALVRDYSAPGDLVVDPCAGGGTTLRACEMEGRRSIGAELDPETYAIAKQLIGRPTQRPLFGGAQ